VLVSGVQGQFADGHVRVERAVFGSFAQDKLCCGRTRRHEAMRGGGEGTMAGQGRWDMQCGPCERRREMAEHR